MLRLLLVWITLLLMLVGCGGQAQSPTPTNPQSTAVPTATIPPSADSTVPADVPTPTPQPTSAPLDVPALETGSAPPTPVPTSEQFNYAPDQPIRVVIDTINLDQSLVNVGLDENLVPIVPRHDVGWYHYSARPGGGENIVLWGHVLRFQDAPDIPAPFARLNEVNVGDQITVYNASNEAFTYVISELVWATPDQVEYILPQGSEMLTLVSCIGDQVIVDGSVQMTHRLITIATPA